MKGRAKEKNKKTVLYNFNDLSQGMTKEHKSFSFTAASKRRCSVVDPGETMLTQRGHLA